MSITFTGRPQGNDYNVESEYVTRLLAKCRNVLHTPNKYHEHTWYPLYRASLLLLHHPSPMNIYRPVLASSNSLFEGLPSPSSSIWSTIQNFIASQILNLGISWKYVVIFMPWPTDSWRNSPWYLPQRELGGPQVTIHMVVWLWWQKSLTLPQNQTGVWFLAGAGDFCLLQNIQPALGHTSLPFNGYWGPYPGHRVAEGVNLTTYLHLVLLLRICGTIPLFPMHAFTNTKIPLFTQHRIKPHTSGLQACNLAHMQTALLTPIFHIIFNSNRQRAPISSFDMKLMLISSLILKQEAIPSWICLVKTDKRIARSSSRLFTQ
jgi:hypothetical protein